MFNEKIYFELYKSIIEINLNWSPFKSVKPAVIYKPKKCHSFFYYFEILTTPIAYRLYTIKYTMSNIGIWSYVTETRTVNNWISVSNHVFRVSKNIVNKQSIHVQYACEIFIFLLNFWFIFFMSIVFDPKTWNSMWKLFLFLYNLLTAENA